MSIEYIAGNLFLNENNAKAYAHGVNVEGVMNSLIAIEFRNRYPQMYDEYRRLCTADPPEFNVGDSFLWKARDSMWVFNLGVLEDSYLKLTSRRKIESAFSQMREQADENSIDSIAMPPVAGGVGGLHWGRSRNIVERVFKKWPGTLYIYVKPTPAR